VLGFACPVSEIGAVLPLSGLLGFACPASEIWALLGGRRLSAEEDGFFFSVLLSQRRPWLCLSRIGDRGGSPFSSLLGFAILCGFHFLGAR
jgi:hypothetical protein